MARKTSENFDAQREFILDCAVEVFATEGFAQASMNRVAERAGVSKSLIYHYYTGKETLLFEAVLNYLNRLSAQIVSLADEPREQELREKLHRLLQGYRDARSHHMIMMTEVRNLAHSQRDQIQALQKALVDDMRSAISRRLPAMASDDVKAVTMLVFGMVNWIYTWYSEAGPVSHAKLIQLVDTMVSGAMRSLGGEAASVQGGVA